MTTYLTPEVLAQVGTMTDNNDHTGARLLIAKTYKMEHYTKLLEAINIIHDTEGHLPHLISEYRNILTNQMLDIIARADQEDVNELTKVL